MFFLAELAILLSPYGFLAELAILLSPYGVFFAPNDLSFQSYWMKVIPEMRVC